MDNLVEKPKYVIYGGTFLPPTINHVAVAKGLSVMAFDKVIIYPRGFAADRSEIAICTNQQRMDLCRAAFQGIDKVEFDFTDLQNNIFTDTYPMSQVYEKFCEAWFAIGADCIVGGDRGLAQVQIKRFNGLRIWNELNFVVVRRPGYYLEKSSLPPKSIWLNPGLTRVTATVVRERIKVGKSISGFVPQGVEKYIKENKLFL